MSRDSLQAEMHCRAEEPTKRPRCIKAFRPFDLWVPFSMVKMWIIHHPPCEATSLTSSGDLCQPLASNQSDRDRNLKMDLPRELSSPAPSERLTWLAPSVEGKELFIGVASLIIFGSARQRCDGRR